MNVETPVILREVIPALTLDAAVLLATESFPNGCHFRAIFEADGSVRVEQGCAFPYAITLRDYHYLLRDYIEKHSSDNFPISEATKDEMKMRKTGCPRCHHPLFKARTA